MRSDQLVLGIDGGGTKTVAWLARTDTSHEFSVVGRGAAGPANPQAVDLAVAVENLDRAVADAFSQSGVEPGPVAAAVLAVAGSDRQQRREAFRRWTNDRRLAHRVRTVHDALPVLIAGSPRGCGIALIAGTGSSAFGRTRDGQSARAGGWGFLFGDEGSGYAIALAGLRAAACAADGREPPTQLLEALLDRLRIDGPEQLVSAVYRLAADRPAIASLAGVVTECAQRGDAVARHLLDEAAEDLGVMVAAVAEKLGLAKHVFPLALAGGVLQSTAELRTRLEFFLDSRRLRAEPVTMVDNPVAGAVRMAISEVSGSSQAPE